MQVYVVYAVGYWEDDETSIVGAFSSAAAAQKCVDDGFDRKMEAKEVQDSYVAFEGRRPEPTEKPNGWLIWGQCIRIPFDRFLEDVKSGRQLMI